MTKYARTANIGNQTDHRCGKWTTIIAQNGENAPVIQSGWMQGVMTTAENGRIKMMISREKAIRILDPATSVEALAEIEYYAGFSDSMAVIKAMHDARRMGAEALRNERPKGRWVGIQSEKFIGYDEWGEPMYRLCSYYTCRKCGRKTVVKTNFCPNCGADMRDGEEE